MSRSFSFVGGAVGAWSVRSQRTVCGEPLAEVRGLTLVDGFAPHPDAAWTLRGITSNERYVERVEKTQLVARQEGLGRPQAVCAALIPIRKSPAWWLLTQDERRAVFEAQSRHIAIGLDYLPAVARRLHHCRDVSQQEPFDFLTWFEFAPEHEAAFDAMLTELRSTAEWGYVEREVDIRLVRPTG